MSQNLDAAIADFTFTISLDPEFASGFYHRGIALQRLGRIQEACPDLLKALNMGMRERENSLGKSVSESKLGQYPPARQQ